MTWDDLRVLDALVRTGSAAAAGRELRVSTSTVYRRIAALEKDVGSACIVRGQGLEGVTLTDVGRGLLATAQRTRLELAQLRARARAADKQLRGEVGLTTVEGFLPLLEEPLERFADAHPGLRVSLHLADSGPSVRKREVDVAIGVMARPPEGLIGKRLFRIEFAVFGSAEARARTPLRWVLAGAPMLHTPEAAWERSQERVVALETGSRLALFALVRRGVGVALMPRRVAALYPELSEVEAFASQTAVLTRDAWLLVHPDVHRSARVKALTQALREAFA